MYRLIYWRTYDSAYESGLSAQNYGAIYIYLPTYTYHSTMLNVTQQILSNTVENAASYTVYTEELYGVQA